MSKVHHLKTHPEPFRALVRAWKHHDIRENDRDYQVDDVLHLQEWNPESEAYTGDDAWRRVTYITYGGHFGLPLRLCVMSVWPCGEVQPSSPPSLSQQESE